MNPVELVSRYPVQMKQAGWDLWQTQNPVSVTSTRPDHTFTNSSIAALFWMDFFFFFGSHHSMGTAIGRALWSGAVLMEDNPVSESPVSGSSKEEGKPCLLLLC